MDIKKSIAKHFKVIAFMLFFSLFFSCTSSYYFKLAKVDYDSTFLIRGPSTCTHIILLNRDGNGKIMRGRTADEYTKEFRKFDEVEFVSIFKIDSKDELIKINNIINDISNSELKSSGYLLDSRHKEFFIGKEKKYDVYGWKANDLNKLLLKLSPHLPYDINSQCESSSGIRISTD